MHLSVVPEEELFVAPSRGLVGLAETMVRSRHEIALATRRGATIAATLEVQDRSATITAREPNGIEWTISVSAAETPRP